MKTTTLNLKDFRNKISDIARPNRFEVQIIPPAMYSWDETQIEMLSWLAETAQIPPRTQGEVKIKFHGMELSLPGDYEKEPLTIGFINSYGWEGKLLFDQWFEMIQTISDVNNRESSFVTLYGAEVKVNQLGRTEKDILASYLFYDVFPTNISAIELNMGEYDSIEKFTVTFAYSHFVSLDVGETNV
jgi:hypothetical protein